MVLAGLLAALLPTVALANQLTISVADPAVTATESFHMGSATTPDGTTLTLDRNSLLLDGHPWTPVMGEFHYARYPENEWREELLKMKAGGIDIVTTYVFWIHHEEIEGQFDWSRQRDLRHFVETARDVGLKVIVRCGPWCHGEVRNGGLPDWLLKKGWNLRSNDERYLKEVAIFYGEIGRQLNGLLWKDGGPVIGVQLENEFYGPAEHLLTLKCLAREAGLDVPLYTRTGWTALTTRMPFGEIVPLYGVYAEGFWDRQLTSMPDTYKDGFFFSKLRADSAIGTDILGQRDVQDAPDADRYPYLTCEIGAGMMSSYHRRILARPEDAEAVTLVKLGSGSVLPGYYMYHGGENPDGKLSTLEESQATGYWNDMPVKNYDFQTALGEYGQLRPQYHLLRRLHLFLHEWGTQLADMPTALPDEHPKGRNDVSTLRWCVCSNGTNGFVFVNNYQRLQEMPEKSNVQFAVNLPSGPLVFPAEPAVIPADTGFIWPFNLDLGHSARLLWATAQPVTAIDDGDTRTIFFAETKNVPAQFAFANDTCLTAISSNVTRLSGQTVVRNVKPGPGVALRIKGDKGSVQIVLLNEAQSLALWKGKWQGRERIFLTSAGLVFDGDQVRLTSTNSADLKIGVCPAPNLVAANSERLAGKTDGVFQLFTPPAPALSCSKPAVEELQPAGLPRDIPLGKIKDAVAAAPVDVDFKQAAVWRIKLPGNLDLKENPLLRLNYVGDVARVTLNGKLLTDDFYNGNVFEVGLRRYAPEILTGDLRVEILPLRKDAPIYLDKKAKPDFGGQQSVVSLNDVVIVPAGQIALDALELKTEQSAKSSDSTAESVALKQKDASTKD